VIYLLNNTPVVSIQLWIDHGDISQGDQRRTRIKDLFKSTFGPEVCQAGVDGTVCFTKVGEGVLSFIGESFVLVIGKADY